MAKTFRSVFPTVAVHPVHAADSVGNVIVVATEGAMPEKLVLEQNWERLRAEARGAPDLRVAIRHRREGPIRFDDVPLLTDGYAPTDALLVG